MDLPKTWPISIEINELDVVHSLLRSEPVGPVTFCTLPDPLRKQLRAILVALDRRSIERFAYDPSTGTVHVNRMNAACALSDCFEEAVLEKAQDALALAAWYLRHTATIANSRYRATSAGEGYAAAKRRYDQLPKFEKQKTDEPRLPRTTWTCLCCGQEVPVRRDWCENSRCESWRLYHQATGETVLQEIRSRTA